MTDSNLGGRFFQKSACLAKEGQAGVAVASFSRFLKSPPGPPMSALLRKRTYAVATWDVRFVPITNIAPVV